MDAMENSKSECALPQQERMPAPEKWHIWHDGANSPAFNMAADEAMLDTAAERGAPLLRFYSWNCRAVSIGYIQCASAVPEGFAFVRRPTGGGVVYHDFDFTYSIAFPSGHWLNALDRNLSYDWINRCVQKALLSLDCQARLSDDVISHDVDRASMVCFTNPTRYDVLLDGRKIAGSAQRRTAAGILHQGSIHFGGELPYPRETLANALQKAFEEIMSVSFMPFDAAGEFLALCDKKVKSKYGTDDWNFKR